jgi:hypothetical protein
MRVRIKVVVRAAKQIETKAGVRLNSIAEPLTRGNAGSQTSWPPRTWRRRLQGLRHAEFQEMRHWLGTLPRRERVGEEPYSFSPLVDNGKPWQRLSPRRPRVVFWLHSHL